MVPSRTGTIHSDTIPKIHKRLLACFINAVHLIETSNASYLLQFPDTFGVNLKNKKINKVGNHAF